MLETVPANSIRTANARSLAFVSSALENNRLHRSRSDILRGSLFRMGNKLAGWAVELTYFRTKVGTEFEIIERLAQKESDLPTFFGTYGYFDLAAIKCITDLSIPSLVPLDYDLLESAAFRFFSDAENSAEDFVTAVRSWRTGIAVFLKINPLLFQADSRSARWRTAKFLQEHFQSVHVFFGLGYSELLVLTGGDDLPQLLSNVTKLRDAPYEDGGCDPLFVRTTTFPLVSHGLVHQPGAYHALSGAIHPVVTISCAPAAENALVRSLPATGVAIRNLYGDSDLIVYWPSAEGVSFGEFARLLTQFRSRWRNMDAVVKTTSYLEAARGPASTAVEQEPQIVSKEPIHPNLLPKLQTLQPLALRASVSDLILRLSSCVHDPTIAADYRDMLRTFPYIESAVDAITSASSELNAVKARLVLTEIADLGRAAINQRYAGLETHPETLAHSQSPVLCDVRSLVLAASSLPHFIFNNLHRTRKDFWAGYVLFGSTYWPLQHEQNILALPVSSLFRPIEEWWKVTHEVAHAVHDLFKINQKIDDPLIHDALEELYDGRPESAAWVVNEIFANWFDWKYIFFRDTSFFLRSIWRSWLKFPAVWEQKHQYLVRGFAIWLVGSLSELATKLASGRRSEHVFPYLHEQWHAFRQLLQDVPDASEYFSDVTEPMLEDVFRQILTITLFLQFLEKRFENICGLEGLSDRLNPPYSNVERQVDSLIAGEVITDEIVNPCGLHLSLLKRLNSDRPPLQTEIAFVLSLEHWFIKATD